MQGIIRSVFLNNQFTRVMIAREQAELLAYSGVQLAIAQLTIVEEKEEGAATASSDKPKTIDITKMRLNVLKKILPHLNRWQTFNLSEKHDQINGTIQFCISSEQGKLNINQIFDFKTMAFKKPYNDLMQGLDMPPLLQRGEVHDRLVEFLKKRKKPIQDVSELLMIPGLQSLDIFYNPPKMPGKDKTSVPNKNVTLLDIFTVWADNDKIYPLLLSDGTCALFGLRRPHADDAIKQKEMFKKLLGEIKSEHVQDIDANWSVVEPLFGQKTKIVSLLKNNFAKEFGSTVYSVLSCGKVDEVECKLLAILKEQDVSKKPAKNPKEKATDEAIAETDNQPKKVFKVLRLYWL
jgi:hypothetical protein